MSGSKGLPSTQQKATLLCLCVQLYMNSWRSQTTEETSREEVTREIEFEILIESLSD